MNLLYNTASKLLAAAFCFCALFAHAQENGQSLIRINQSGYYPQAPKIAIVVGDTSGTFHLQTVAGKALYTGKLRRSAKPDFAGDYTGIADFSSFNKPGKYVLSIPGVGTSYQFAIRKDANQPVAAGTIKAFYFIRVSTPIEAKYAGKWARAEGHPDNRVLVHASAATSHRPEGTVISSPRGCYDAGDYNKYVVNSGISTYTLLSLYEDFPQYAQKLKLNIPESGNQLPDVIDESLWNLRWMLTMQDPNDGGVYHKLTNAAFDGMIMPDKAIKPRYVVQKSTAATLDFAAVMAQGARIFRNYPKQLPGLADSCLRAAEYAWQWAKKNPDSLYIQNRLNQKYSPKITTGDYGDGNVKDEFTWAASELFVTTGDKKYSTDVNLVPDAKMSLPSWGNVRTLGYYTLLRYKNQPAVAAYPKLGQIKQQLIAFADSMIKDAHATAFQSVMYKQASNFNWGSNSNAGNQGIALIKAYLLTGDKRYLPYALDNLDYIMGRNGTGYAYVTGFGSKTPMHPHHRPSVADGIVDPIPGLLAGGPNPGMQDGIKVPSIVPDRAYIDDDRAYAANEIAINWNAPLAYLANAIEALQKQIR